MTNLPDLERYIQRRRLRNYERGMARLSYAYGVDVRRSRWLASSSIGNSLVRAIDRRWPELSRELLADDLRDPGGEAPTALLQRIRRLRHLLRAPLPAIRVLTPEARRLGTWPLVTPLGPTHGDVHWLVLDLEGLRALPESHQDFLIGSGLGHLQCDHGVFFAAHLLAARHRAFSLRLFRRILGPWSRVMVFSADRAGMLAAGDLDTAVDVLRKHDAADRSTSWLPTWPPLEERILALQEFDRSVVMARLRAIRERVGEGAEVSVFESTREDETDDPGEESEADAPKDAPADASATPPGIPADAWSLARCDERLTRRLGLL